MSVSVQFILCIVLYKEIDKWDVLFGLLLLYRSVRVLIHIIHVKTLQQKIV